ncbi:MAG: C4-dicarboxylate ABC transporter substrate-binding protein [Candidatus Entotheonella factor]|uniref:C4-dicarboxylate ABC transporter substrate-binding protein n=1 Tax=Entotheonella factor TaxID=1429438 RepID=W4LYL1_ENTF1|nr:MAG: C4-dicarboxylate ABC transporter substrate-binding protein [Candidatus Entotheonella factor]
MMSIHHRHGLIVVLFMICLTTAILHGNTMASDKTTVVTIGTSSVTDLYYPTGGAISRMINAKRQQYRVRALVEPTEGSVDNVNAVMEGHLTFSIVQSDHQYQAWKGLAKWKNQGRQKTLRSVLSIYAEHIILVASEKSGIKKLTDLVGNRVNIGNPGSQHYQNAIDIVQAIGLDAQKDFIAETFKSKDSSRLLQNGRIDAFFYTAQHPSRVIQEATSGTIKVRLIPIAGPAITTWLKTFPYYAPSQIPKTSYPHAINQEDIPTVGMKATLVTSIQAPVLVVYAMVKEVFDHFDQFKALHPAFAPLTKQNMLEGLTAPLHPGALKYYLETGLKP